MSRRTQFIKSIKPLAWGAALSAAVAGAASAQQRQLFSWNGRVDQEVQLTITGRSVTTANIGPSEPGSRGARLVSALPRTDGLVSVSLLDGRGTADVIQQPSAQNGYTAIIRVRDPQGGVGGYRLAAYWQPAAAGEVGPPFGRDREDRDNRYDRNGYGRDRVALTWSGDVDDNLEIRLTPNGTNYRTIRGVAPRGIQTSFRGMPQGDHMVAVNQTEGRGQIVVVQQPTYANGYTTVLRIRDPQPGYGHYSFNLSWR